MGLGINVVVGPNGAGKTSILDGISFALFNEYSNRGKKHNLVNNKANRCSVGLTFTEAGICYDAEWTLEKRGSAHGSLFRTIEGKRVLLARGGERSVAKEIQKVLGIDKSMFLQSIYVRQGEIEQLVNAKPAERKALISRLLGVEDLEKAWSNLRDVIEVYRDRLFILEGELIRKPEFEKQKADAEARSKELEELLVSKRTELGELESRQVSLQAILDEMDSRKRDFEKLDKEKVLAEHKIESLESKLESQNGELRKAEAAAEILSSLKRDVEKLPLLDSYVSSLLEKESLENKLSVLDEKLKEISELEKIQEQNTESHNIFLEKERQIEEKRLQRKEYEGCPKALEAARRQLEKYEKEERRRKENLAREVDKYSVALGQPIRVDNLQAILEENKGQIQKKTQDLDDKIREADGSISVLRQRIKELDDNLSKFSSEADVKACPTCDTELPHERVLQLIKKFSSEQEDGRKRITILEESLQEAVTEREYILSKKNQIDSIDPQRLVTLQSDLDNSLADITAEKSEISELEKQTEILSALDDELKDLEVEKAAAEGGSKEFELATRRLEKVPSKKEIATERQPLQETLQEVFTRFQQYLENLGYTPSKPQEELIQLRKKKEEYDQNFQIALRKTEHETNVRLTTEELEDSRVKHLEIASRINKLGYNEKLHETKREELDHVISDVKELSVDLAGKEQAKISADNEAKKYVDELAALDVKVAERKAVSKYVLILNKIRDAYGKDGIQKIIRAKAKPILEKATRDLFERFNLAYSDVRIDDDYNISVIGSSGEQDIDQISGGERVALAIALRLAIAQVLSGRIETVIMDEPTTHLDEERRKELVNILNSFFREGGRIIPQMLIITHHNEIEEVADVVYSVKKKDGYSTIESEKLIATL